MPSDWRTMGRLHCGELKCMRLAMLAFSKPGSPNIKTGRLPCIAACVVLCGTHIRRVGLKSTGMGGGG